MNENVKLDKKKRSICYEKALCYYKDLINKRDYMGMCNKLSQIAFSEFGFFYKKSPTNENQILREHFPELYRFKPQNCNSYWYPLNENGVEPRIKALANALVLSIQ